MVARFHKAEKMNKRKATKLIHEGEYAAEVDVELIISGDDWSPYLSLSDAHRLDEVRQALRTQDLQAASKLARVYRLMPVAA